MFYMKFQSSFCCGGEEKTSKKSISSSSILCRPKNTVIHGTSSQTAVALSYTKSVVSFNTGIVKIYTVHAQNSEAENELYAFRERFRATF
jgi:hypothetical protein